MNKKKQIYCNSCQRSTWHDILHNTKKQTSYDCTETDISEYSFAQCRGCKDARIHIKTSTLFNGTKAYDSETLYPPKTLRSKPKWFRELSETTFRLDKLLSEIYISLQNRCTRLAVMGIRALLEHIMIEKCGDKHSFEKNIKAFEDEGFVSPIQKTALCLALEAGHATMHRSFEPKNEHVLAALDITENIIESIYILSNAGETALTDVPPRSPTK